MTAKKRSTPAGCTYSAETIDKVTERLEEIEATLEALANSFGPEDDNYHSQGYHVPKMCAALLREANALLIDGEVKHG